MGNGKCKTVTNGERSSCACVQSQFEKFETCYFHLQSRVVMAAWLLKLHNENQSNMIRKFTWFFFLSCLISVSLCTEEWPCPEPPLIANGEALVRWDGLMALYRCTVGYVLRGSPTMSCVGNNWIGPAPYCIPEELYAPPTQLFGDRERKLSSPKEVPPRHSTLRTISGRHYQQEYNLPHHGQSPSVEPSSSYARPLFQWDPVHQSAQRTSNFAPKQQTVSEHHKNSRHYQVTKRLLGSKADALERPLNIRTVVVHAKPQQDAPKTVQKQVPASPKKRRKQRKGGGGGKKSRINAENERRVLSSPPPPVHPEESLMKPTSTKAPVEVQGNGTYHVTESTIRMVPVQDSFVPMPQEAIRFQELDMSCMHNDGDGKVYFLAPPTIDNGGVDLFRRRHHQLADAPANGSYLEAYYACQEPYKLRKDYEHSLYCAKGLWVGQIPVCVSKVENPPGHVDLDKDVKVDLCLVDNGGCEHICETVVGSDVPKCLCFRGFSLKADNRTCADINECLIRNGDCQLSCWNMPGSYICNCPEGYTLSSDRQSCADKNECLLNNGHGPCQDKCANTVGGYECTCTIKGTQLAIDNHTCEDIDECADDNFGCSHSCLNTIGSAFCTCPEGFMLNGDWKTCTDIDECEYPEMVSGCSGHCINTIGSYKCGTIGNDHEEAVEELRASASHLTVCGEGYHADGEGECVDIDECANNEYGCSQECINTEGSAVCTCPEGLQLLEDWKTCDDVDECQQGNNGCSHTCVNIHASAYCTCPQGFELSADRHTCQDLDECSTGNITCEYQCVNTPGGAHCSCPDGFHLSNDGKSCEDVNECLTESHVCSEVCLNTYGSYHCACPDGYRISGENRTECEDINECLEGNGGCTGDCINSDGSYHCSCSSFHRLASDERTCITDACPAAAVPDGGEIICKVPHTNGHYPLGTSCEVRCGADTKLVGSSQITCTSEGRWDTSGHYCLRVPEAPHVHVPETDHEIHTVHVQLRCPPHVTGELHPGSRISRVTLPRPHFEPDAEPEPEVRVTPSWAQGYVGDFPPGTTIVTYASSTSECSFKVTVIDQEAPGVQDCPEPFDTVLAEDATTATVTWKEPIFHDNVGVDYIWKSKEPGSEFSLGLHNIRYLARDAAGNSVQCNFDINVKYGDTVVTATSPPTKNVQFQWNKYGCTYINSQKTDWLIKWPALQGCLSSPRTHTRVASSAAFNYQARGIIQEHYSEKVVTSGFGTTRTRGGQIQESRAPALSPQHKE